jgi:hypothetical protein
MYDRVRQKLGHTRDWSQKILQLTNGRFLTRFFANYMNIFHKTEVHTFIFPFLVFFNFVKNL